MEGDQEEPGMEKVLKQVAATVRTADVSRPARAAPTGYGFEQHGLQIRPLKLVDFPDAC